jgi:uncharacterized membrane protein YccC
MQTSEAQQPGATLSFGQLAQALKAVGPQLLLGLRLWASVCLALYVAFWLELDHAYWAGTSAAIVCQPHLGASLRKGWFRMIGTVIGGAAVLILTACFPQDRVMFLIALALWGAACALVSTLLRNFASYAASLAGYTAAIIASDQLGATGGLNGIAFTLAVTRVSEICIGIVSAGVVLAGTDLGGARRRLSRLFADLAAEITSQCTGTLLQAGSDLPDTRPVRRELVRRVVALDPAIDEGFGESAELRQYSRVLQAAVDGLVAALAGWRTVAVHLGGLRHEQARCEARVVLETLSPELRLAPPHAEPVRWITDPIGLRRICEAAMRRLSTLRADTPSLQLLTDQMVEILVGIANALGGLALLVSDHARPLSRNRWIGIRVPDWLPPLVNAARAFLTVTAVAIFWIVTEWPSGAEAMAFAAIGVILFAPRADQAYDVAFRFTIGVTLGALLAAFIAFAVLPTLEGFFAFSIAIGLVLVPVGAGLAQSWQAPMFMGLAAWFVPLLGPANEMSYNTMQFYNSAVAIVAGNYVAALAFRLIPPLSPAFRTRRLMVLTLRDLRRLATGMIPRGVADWRNRIYGRFSVLPDQAQPLQRSQLLAALSVGTEIIKLRSLAVRVSPTPALDLALAPVARGEVKLAAGRLAELDHSLKVSMSVEVIRARAGILSISESLVRHADYFGSVAR